MRWGWHVDTTHEYHVNEAVGLKQSGLNEQRPPLCATASRCSSGTVARHVSVRGHTAHHRSMRALRFESRASLEQLDNRCQRRPFGRSSRVLAAAAHKAAPIKCTKPIASVPQCAVHRGRLKQSCLVKLLCLSTTLRCKRWRDGSVNHQEAILAQPSKIVSRERPSPNQATSLSPRESLRRSWGALGRAEQRGSSCLLSPKHDVSVYRREQATGEGRLRDQRPLYGSGLPTRIAGLRQLHGLRFPPRDRRSPRQLDAPGSRGRAPPSPGYLHPSGLGSQGGTEHEGALAQAAPVRTRTFDSPTHSETPGESTPPLTRCAAVRRSSRLRLLVAHSSRRIRHWSQHPQHLLAARVTHAPA
eukprot:scaffold7394_cov35-Tisochrysis_lutea.AAC.2